MASQEVFPPLTPLALRSNPQQKVMKHRHHAKQAVVGNGDGVVPVRMLVGTGNLGSDAKGAVPEAGVMGAEVANLVEGGKPRVQLPVSDAVFGGNGLLDGCLNSTEEREHGAKRHQFASHPHWQIGFGGIFGEEMLDEILRAAARFVADAPQKLTMSI